MTEYVTGNLFIRTHDYNLETGHVVKGHCHNFDHVTVFFTGTWEVTQFEPVLVDGKPKLHKVTREIGGEAREVNEPELIFKEKIKIRAGHSHAWCLIKAELVHELRLIEGPGAYGCFYSHRKPNGEVVEEYTGWRAAYE